MRLSTVILTLAAIQAAASPATDIDAYLEARASAELEEQTRLQLQHEEARIERQNALRGIADQFERTVGEVVSGVASASTQLQATRLKNT